MENYLFDFLVVVWLAGEEQVMGGPGLLVMLETVESKVLKEFSVESSSNDSNRLVEKFGIPHLSQCKDTLVRASYWRRHMHTTDVVPLLAIVPCHSLLLPSYRLFTYLARIPWLSWSRVCLDVIRIHQYSN